MLEIIGWLIVLFGMLITASAFCLLNRVERLEEEVTILNTKVAVNGEHYCSCIGNKNGK